MTDPNAFRGADRADRTARTDSGWSQFAPPADDLTWYQPAPTERVRRQAGLTHAAALSLLVVASAMTGGLTALGAAGVLTPTTPGSATAADPGATPTALARSVVATGDDTSTGTTEDVVRVARLAAPAVVVIDTTTDGGGRSSEVTGTGSGVIVDPAGLILTNHHVVGDSDGVRVTLADGRTFTGAVAGVDTLTDLALVTVDATDLPAATLGDSASLEVGQLAVAIGSPLGRYPGSVTSGIVSGLDRDVEVADPSSSTSTLLRHLIQTDAAINPGNSGGPLLDRTGAVIGIDTAEAGQAQGIGFAIPIDLAKPIIEQLLAGQVLARPWIGIQYTELDAQVAADNDLELSAGAWIARVPGGGAPVIKGSPAADAGLKVGDIIVSIGGQAIDAQHPLDVVLLSHLPGDQVTLQVRRDRRTIKVQLTLGTRPAGSAR